LDITEVRHEFLKVIVSRHFNGILATPQPALVNAGQLIGVLHALPRSSKYDTCRFAIPASLSFCFSLFSSEIQPVLECTVQVLRYSEMAKDDNTSIPAWQRAASEHDNDEKPTRPSDDLAAAEQAAEGGMPSFNFKDVDELTTPPTREEAKKFLEHPGTKDASLEDRIRFLEVKNVKREDIEALLPGARNYFAAVSSLSE
jgi:Pex14 N-terminal domain